MPTVNIPGYPENQILFKATILSGDSKSEMIATQGYALTGIIMPAAWTAADIGFAVCVTGNPNDLQQMYSNGGVAESCVAAASKPIAFPASDAPFFPYIQILSVDATDEVTPVAQGGDRVLYLIFRKFLS